MANLDVFPTPTNIETRLFINGKFVHSNSGKTFAVTNPATEQVVAQVYEAEFADVDVAVDAAEAAFPSWSELGGFERAKFFYRLADLLEQSNSELAALEAISMGRPVGQYSMFKTVL
jgi:acyl-CoA reductase-like NAD-dependent aldehyde dehydrogenase